MKSMLIVLAIGLFFTIGFVSCDDNSGVSPDNLIDQDITFRDSSDILTKLCIGCGCSSDFKACRDAADGSPHACCIPPGLACTIDLDCCKEERGDCHTCNTGFICVRWKFIQDTTTEDFYQISDPISYADSVLLDPYWDQVIKFKNNEEMTDTDFDKLDSDLID